MFLFLYAMAAHSETRHSISKVLKQKKVMVTPEERLLNYLFGDNTYSKKVPPVLNETHLKINIEIELELMGVMNVD